MGHVARALRAERVLASVVLLVTAAGTAQAQGVWDDPAFALYRQAVDAMERKEHARAAALAAKAVAEHPQHVLALYLRGQAAAAQARWEEAAQAFAGAAALYPKSFAAQRDLAGSYDQLGRTDDAARAYAAALALRDDEDVRVRLALMLARAGRTEDALGHLRALAERDSKSPDAWTTLGRLLYERGDVAGSEKALARATSLRDDGATWFNLGVVRVRAKDLAGALAAFERAAAHPAVREQAHAEAARIRAAMQRRPESKP